MGDTSNPAGVDRCPTCGLPPATPDDEYCSTACRVDADDSEPIADGLCTTIGIKLFDESLPQGIPRDAFTLLSHEPGSKADAVLTELAWRTLERGEPVVFLSAGDSPAGLLQQFATLEWNPLPHLESGQLQVVDCYTNGATLHAETDAHHSFPGAADTTDDNPRWDSLIESAANSTEDEASRIFSVTNPSSPRSVTRQVDECLNRAGMVDEGVVIVDSLTTLYARLGAKSAYEFIPTLRERVCKERRVQVFAGASFDGSLDDFPHDLEHLVDGVIDLQLTPTPNHEALVSEVIVRKMVGAPTTREYAMYSMEPGRGLSRVEVVEEPSQDDGGGDD